MTHTSRSVITPLALALGAGLLSLTAGCSAGQTQAAATAPPPPNPSATRPSASAKPLTPEDQAVAAAKRVVGHYYQVTDRFGMNPTMNLALLNTVSIGTGLLDARNTVFFYRQKHLRQIGSTKVTYQQLIDVKLTLQPKMTPPRIPTVRLLVCYDVHDVNVVDAKNRSVVTATRPDTGVILYGVSNYSWPHPNGWKVSFTQQKASKCKS